MKDNHQPCISWANVPVKTILTVLEFVRGDGHSIYAPEAFTQMGVPPTLVRRNTKLYQSSPGDHKATIYVNGKAVPAMEGVYGLGIVSDIADHFGVQSFAMGRGFRCAQLTEGLKAVLQRKEK